MRGARGAAAVGALSANSPCLWAPRGSPSAAALPAGGGRGRCLHLATEGMSV